MARKPSETPAGVVGSVHCHFFDSGAFSQVARARDYARAGHGKWDYYSTPEATAYLDAYAAFVKKYRKAIDYYANVDVIQNPELSWRNLKYLEKEHGLAPVPVLHHGTDVKWLHKHLDAGYEFIGMGGIAGNITVDAAARWIDSWFRVICDQPSRLPKIRVHGFGMTSFALMRRFPFWSTDSATWTKLASYGGIFVPAYRKGKFNFVESPTPISMSAKAPAVTGGKHYLALTESGRARVRLWLDEIGVPLGQLDKGGEVVEHGVITRHSERKIANILFFERFRETLPAWPWPFTSRAARGLLQAGLLSI